MVSWATPPEWFVRELSWIDPGLTVRWNNRMKRWVVYHKDGSPCLIVQHPEKKTFRNLDRRTLRKLQINVFFTRNDKALMLYTDDVRKESEINSELRQYITRGLDGISDHLSGWDKED